MDDDMNADEWRQQLISIGALWLHDGNPLRPHALLTSGRHSGGFVDCGKITQNPTILQSACDALVLKLLARGLMVNQVSRVVGPAMGAITIAHDLARLITSCRTIPGSCLCGYAEKAEIYGEPAMEFNRTPLIPGELVLMAEDVLTTGGSVEKMAKAIRAASATAFPFVTAIINRSGRFSIEGREIVALIDLDIPSHDAADCKYCNQGSVAIKPKIDGNWRKLIQSYA